jgi:hypothetical protein
MYALVTLSKGDGCYLSYERSTASRDMLDRSEVSLPEFVSNGLTLRSMISLNRYLHVGNVGSGLFWIFGFTDRIKVLTGLGTFGRRSRREPSARRYAVPRPVSPGGEIAEGLAFHSPEMRHGLHQRLRESHAAFRSIPKTDRSRLLPRDAQRAARPTWATKRFPSGRSKWREPTARCGIPRMSRKECFFGRQNLCPKKRPTRPVRLPRGCLRAYSGLRRKPTGFGL